jgi:type IV pilus assembly protein PilV
MSLMRRSRVRTPGRGSARGFSLIEVLIALVVLAVGLLGVAMMQTINLRFTQSANHRTIATNLAYELLDMARSNRVLSSRYAMTYATFGNPTVPSTGCARGGNGDPDANVARWKCEVRASLPNGEAEVVFLGEGRIRVNMRWTDAHWQAADQQTEFSVESRL